MVTGELEQIARQYELGHLTAARETCLTFADRARVDPDMLRRLALVALRSADAATAIRLMEKAVLIRPEDAEYHNVLGNAYRQAQELQRALGCFQRAAELAANCAEAHNNWGACLLELGDTEGAVARFEQSLALDPYLPAALYNLGNARQIEGRIEDAIACYHQVLWYEPDHADAHANLGAALHQQHKNSEAAEHYRRSLELHPGSAEAHNNLGALFHERKDIGRAIECYRRALALDDHYLSAWANLGDALVAQGDFAEAAAAYLRALEIHPQAHDVRSKLSGVFQQLNQLDDAEECCRKLIEFIPESPEAWNNLGVVLQLREKTPEAVDCYERALQFSAANADTQANLAAALRVLGKFERARNCYERAIRLQPDSSRAHIGLADVLLDERQLTDARHHYGLAVHFDPENADVQLHCALSRLRMGDFPPGWRGFEWRWKSSSFPRAPETLSIPRWKGEPLAGQTIVIHAEQGLGDTIQFVRYLPQIQERGGKVVFCCAKELVPLLQHVAGVDQFALTGQSLPTFDYYAPLLSLPAIFGTTVETIPAPIPYLFADATLIASWSTRLAQLRGIKVGICYRGNPQHRRDRFRSIPREYFEELMQDGVSGVNLQREVSSQTANLSQASGIINLADELDAQAGSFMDTAAVMKSLDLVITCDTSLAHLAGALGVPVWLALDFGADWRWLLDRDDSPWYPTMRLFRQTAPGDWGGVFQKIKKALRALRDNRDITKT